MITLSQMSLPHGITLSCRSAGDVGRPVLMFLHGFPEAAFVWDGLLEFFSQAENGGYRCIAPNLRGFERSSAPAEVSAYRPKHLVQDITALIALETAGAPSDRLACLVAHDWGGAVAWNLAASQPQWLDKLVIINAPHPATFLRELQHSPAQQAASAYMSFLVRPDAETLLAANDFARMWPFFTAMGAAEGLDQWLTNAVKAQYREVWLQGLTGARRSCSRWCGESGDRHHASARNRSNYPAARTAGSQIADTGDLGAERQGAAARPAEWLAGLRAAAATAASPRCKPLDIA